MKQMDRDEAAAPHQAVIPRAHVLHVCLVPRQCFGSGDHARWPAWHHTSMWCLRDPVLVMSRTAMLAGIAVSPRWLTSSNRTHAHSRSTTRALVTRSSRETHAY